MKMTDYSIKNTIVIRFLVFILFIGGIFSYIRLGKLEDPEFKIKEALVITLYPQADAHTVELNVTDKIEEALNKIPNIDYLQSVSKPGYSEVKIKLDEGIDSDKVEQYWDNVRRKVSDAQLNLPLGVVPSIVLDDYGAVYGMFLAVTSDGYTYSELKRYTEYITKELNSIKGIAQVAQFGKPTDAIEVIIDREKINSMGISDKSISLALLSQNLITGGGTIDYGDLRVNLRLNNEIKTIEELGDLVIFSKKLPNGTDEIIRLKDIAQLKRDYVEPINQKMYYNDKMAMGISLSPVTGTNVVETGKLIDEKIAELKEKLPVGINIEKIYYQPDLVTSAINNFVLNLIMSVVTVVGVLLFTMGMKSGLIIGSGLVLSILGTLIFMYILKIDMQRVSLGSFIIAMGMLVDNSIVIVDGVLVNRNKGMEMEDALKEACYKPALPLLGATVIAAIAFMPSYFMPTYAGEYVSSAFLIIGISLILSWFLCLTQTPVYCKLYLENEPIKKETKKEKKFYKKCHRLLYALLRIRKTTLTVLLGAFVVSCLMFLGIPRTFFPDSDKKGFTINMWAPEGSKVEVVEEKAKELSEYLRTDERVKDITITVGASPSRYYIATLPEMPNPSFAQLIINVKKTKDVDIIGKKAMDYAQKNIIGVTTSVKKYPNGIPTQYPIEIAFSGPDPKILRELSNKTINIMKKYPEALNIKTNWRNKILTWEGDYSKINGKRANISPLDISTSLMRTTDGLPIGKLKENDNLVTVILKENSENKKNQIDNLKQTPIWGTNFTSQSLSSVIENDKLTYEEGQVWRRNRIRTMIVQCDVPVGINAEEVRSKFSKEIEKINLPKGYKMYWLGEYYEQDKNNMALLKAVPVPALMMLIICVLLFGSVKIATLIFISLPLAMIGIAPGLIITGKTFGFMSIVGFISLSGMMIKNIIVLVDEINYEINVLKKDKFTALIDSAISRIRSVGLAALTTIFGMIPLLWDPLYKDMAATIIFGLFASTILTLFIFPIIYSVVYNIKPNLKSKKYSRRFGGKRCLEN
ncbi:efflux RND transporter permease subunit [Fusobacterium perfoetens]|uniref:efflux RND transporter permease subunit n=1 Tax=Fusobacterium perfoetens TaxID=852 RepID=UPI000685E4A7|nr:efflux RND transporter permease subunit [Fusobacterium perfoetens]